ncbi:MAG: efflux RND transporter permease subunit, partial [Chitinivibrionales bacterium]
MSKIIEHFLKFPIWANVLMLAILIVGFSALTNLRTSFFPERDPKRVSVSVSYPGSSPEEIEKSIISRIEDKIDGIQGIDEYSSVSNENYGNIRVQAKVDADIDEVYEDVRTAVDRVSPWPTGAEPPQISKTQFSMPVLAVSITGADDLWTLKQRAEALEDELLKSESVSLTTIRGLPEREIEIAMEEAVLRGYNLTFNAVENAVKASNVDISGGKIETAEEDLYIRAYSKEAEAEHIEDIVVYSDVKGNILRVGDVAEVREGWKESGDISRYNGKRAVTIMVNQSEDEDMIEVAAQAREAIKGFSEEHPDIDVTVAFDSTDAVNERIKMLTKNGLIGLILVFIILTVFLKARVAFWVAVGIPVSFAGTFIIAAAANVTINMMTLFAMIIVVGILVDDAIVVAEQTFQGIEDGMAPLKAAWYGVNKVIAPVFTSVTTTIIAFVPFFFFKGRIGEMVWQLALIIISALFFSLVESFIILPSHLGHSMGDIRRRNRFREKIDKAYFHVTHNIYGKTIKWITENRIIALAVSISFVIVTVGMLKGGLIRSNPFPQLDRGEVEIEFTLPQGTQEEVTDSIVGSIRKNVLSLGEKLNQEYGYEMFTSIRSDIQGNTAEMEIELAESEVRSVSSMEISKRVRKAVPDITGAQKFSIGGGGHWGNDIDMSLTSPDMDKLQEAKEFMKSELSSFDKLTNVGDEDSPGPRELNISIRPDAYALGLSRAEIMNQIRDGFYGKKIQSVQRGQDEIEINVRYKDEKRQSVSQLENMLIRTPSGKEVPLKTLVNYDIIRKSASINHINGKREIRITADLRDNNVSLTNVVESIQSSVVPEFNRNFEKVDLDFRGHSRSNEKFQESLLSSYIPAIIGILVLLILVFRSWVQAILIFLVIPLAVMGAQWGHLIHGLMITRLSTMGMLALAGVVINDSIVFIDQINYNLREQMKLEDAVYTAATQRFRPILMTTITTVAGLLPILLETSFQAQFVIPMAVSLAWGLIFGSMFILTMVPSLFLILNSTRRVVRRLLNRINQELTGKKAPPVTPESVEPAVADLSKIREFKEELY